VLQFIEIGGDHLDSLMLHTSQLTTDSCNANDNPDTNLSMEADKDFLKNDKKKDTNTNCDLNTSADNNTTNTTNELMDLETNTDITNNANSNTNNISTEEKNVLEHSLALLKKVQRTVYFVNCSTLFEQTSNNNTVNNNNNENTNTNASYEPKANDKVDLNNNKDNNCDQNNKIFVHFNVSQLELLLERLQWLSVVFPKSHKILVYLSRLDDNNNTDFNCDYDTNSNNNNCDGDTDNCIEYCFDVPTVTRQILMVANKIRNNNKRNKHNNQESEKNHNTEKNINTGNDHTNETNKQTSTTNTEKSEDITNDKLKLEGRGIEEQFGMILEYFSFLLNWQFAVVGVFQSNHINPADDSLNVHHIVNTTARLFKDEMVHSTSSNPESYIMHHIIKCFRDTAARCIAHDDNTHSFELWVEKENFYEYLDELEFCEIPETILLQKFETVGRKLVELGICLQHKSSNFSDLAILLHLPNDDPSDSPNQFLWSGDLLQEDKYKVTFGVRFPYFPRLLDVVEFYFLNNIPADFWLSDQSQGHTAPFLADENSQKNLSSVIEELENELQKLWSDLTQSFLKFRKRKLHELQKERKDDTSFVQKKRNFIWLLEEWHLAKKLLINSDGSFTLNFQLESDVHQQFLELFGVVNTKQLGVELTTRAEQLVRINIVTCK